MVFAKVGVVEIETKFDTHCPPYSFREGAAYFWC